MTRPSAHRSTAIARSRWTTPSSSASATKPASSPPMDWPCRRSTVTRWPMSAVAFQPRIDAALRACRAGLLVGFRRITAAMACRPCRFETSSGRRNSGHASFNIAAAGLSGKAFSRGLQAERRCVLFGVVSQQPAFDDACGHPSGGTSFSPRAGAAAQCRERFGGVDAEVVGILRSIATSLPFS